MDFVGCILAGVSVVWHVALWVRYGMGAFLWCVWVRVGIVALLLGGARRLQDRNHERWVGGGWV